MDEILGLLPQVIGLKLFWITVGAFVGGVGITQYVKQWFDPKWPRFRVLTQTVAIVATWLLFVLVWKYTYPMDSHHLEKVCGAIVGFFAPIAYKGLKFVVAWKFKAMANRMSRSPDPAP